MMLRWIAVAIALAGVLDPVLVRNRPSDAIVALHAMEGADPTVVAHAARTLGDGFTVVRGPFPGADASVLVGNNLPADPADVSAPVFAILAEPHGLRQLHVHAPERAPADARIPVQVTLCARRAVRVDVTLRWNDAVVDRAAVDTSADGCNEVALDFVPAAASGAAHLRVTTRVAGSARAWSRDIVVDVEDSRWRVLFHDGRPSWMSTFVRRSVEDDPRFAVSARIATSRGLATEIGAHAPHLADAAALAQFNAIVVGAPETLRTEDVSALQMFMRRRGGSVVLLLDAHGGTAVDALTGMSRWQSADGPAVPLRDATADSALLRAGSRVWPEHLPPAAVPLLRDSAGNVVVWQTGVGAGTLVISGARDAWRFRDPDTSQFHRFWPQQLARIAHRAPPHVVIQVPNTARAREWVTARVTLRTAALASHAPGTATRANVAASLQGPSPQTLQLWPVGSTGELAAEFRAPAAAGAYRLVITTEDGEVSAPIIVHDVHDAGSHEIGTHVGGSHNVEDLLQTWTAARGGVALPADRIHELPQLLQQSLRSQPRTAPWHPMRSTWWLLAFASALTVEWWLRRRRGLR